MAPRAWSRAGRGGWPRSVGDSDAELCHDLDLFGALYRERWGELRIRDDRIEAWVTEADTLVACLRDPARYERQRDEALEHAARVAQQTYALMCRAYDELRKAVRLLHSAEGGLPESVPAIPGSKKIVMRVNRTTSRSSDHQRRTTRPRAVGKEQD